MKEKDKMIQGLAYEAWDKDLYEARQHAAEVVFAFNQISPIQRTKRADLLRPLLGKCTSFHIESRFHCDYGFNIFLGENFYSNVNCVMLDCAPIHIGNNVMLAPNVSIYTAGHPLHATPRREGIEYARSVTIGDDVWIGGNSVINAGVTIGNRVVIGSGSVVTKDLPDDVLAFGNPCRIIRKIDEHDREYLYKEVKL